MFARFDNAKIFPLLLVAVENEEDKALVDESSAGSTAKNITMYTALKFKEDGITFHASPDWRKRGPWYDYCFIRTTTGLRGAEPDPIDSLAGEDGARKYRMLAKIWAFTMVGDTVYAVLELYEKAAQYRHPLFKKYQSHAKRRAQESRSLTVVDADSIIAAAVVFPDPDNTSMSPKDVTVLYLPSYVELCGGSPLNIPRVNVLPNPRVVDDGVPTAVEENSSVEGFSTSSSEESSSSSSESDTDDSDSSSYSNNSKSSSSGTSHGE